MLSVYVILITFWAIHTIHPLKLKPFRCTFRYTYSKRKKNRATQCIIFGRTTISFTKLFFSIYLFFFLLFLFFSRIDVILVRKAHLFWHLRCLKISKGKNFKICASGAAQDCRSLSERKSRKRITFCINYKYTKCSNSHIYTYIIWSS